MPVYMCLIILLVNHAGHVLNTFEFVVNIAESQPENKNTFLQKHVTYYLCWDCFLMRGELQLRLNQQHD